MRFLCFHGAVASGKLFAIQLEPLQRELESDNAASFQYVDGPCTLEMPEGYLDYFGLPPHYRWIDDDGSAENVMLRSIRDMPGGLTPEDALRSLREMPEHQGDCSADGYFNWPNQRAVLDSIYALLDANPDIEGVISYSEGTCVAGSLILDEMAREKEEGRPRRIKRAIFFTGWPPVTPDQKVILSDMSSVRIDIPTLHVIGANDPYKYGAMALYNICDEETAVLFDTSKGHTLPRGGPVVNELGDAVRELIGLHPIHAAA